MNIKLIAAAIATLGLAACTPDITPQASADSSGPTTSSAPAQPAPAPAAQDERKNENAAPAEAKADEGGKTDD